MCKLMEKFGERKLEEGRLEGRVESARQTAMALIAWGKLTLSEEVRRWQVLHRLLAWSRLRQGRGRQSSTLQCSR